MGTNIDGKRKVPIAMTAIKGVGRRYANIVLKKADVDLTKRAGECTEEEVSNHKITSDSSDPSNAGFFPPTGRENRHNHPEPTSVQDPQLVLEQTKGHHRWQVHTAHLIQLGLEAP